MFQYIEKVLSKGIFQFQIKQNNRLLSFKEVINFWKTSSDFRFFYNQILKEIPFAGFFWEHKAVNKNKLHETYEFVIIQTDSFNGKQANQQPFAKYFTKKNAVVSFPNLGKNAQLIVPCPSDKYDSYTHLGVFIRNAPSHQIDAFWELVGKEFDKSSSQENPTWLSTSGLGVYWLHIRLDQRPKYYTYIPYKSF